MSKTPNNLTSSRLLLRAFVALAMLASLVAIAPSSSDAQANGQPLEVWGRTTGSKTWKFRQSVAGDDLGSASAAAVNLDDSAWSDVDLRWKTFPGPNVANHFRKDFTLAEIGVEDFQVVGMRVSIQYDDTAVMYLNGVEVYRSIRGNLDPQYATYPEGTNIPHNPDIPYGGFEELYIEIPNINDTNSCEFSGPACGASPYGGPNPPAIDPSLLNGDGVNTWAITTWNRTAGGSNDSSLNHTFELLIDPDAVPPNTVFINEVMASNDSTPFTIDGEEKTPDWFELHNTDNQPVNLQGWTIADATGAWMFPSVEVPANGYLVVVANDDDRIDTDPLRTNFKISTEGDSLRLTNADGFIADEYGALPSQFTDNSFGRPNNSGTPTYLATSTPGQPNGAAGNGYRPIIRFFPSRMYNVGEPISHTVDAFDPDGDTLSFSFSTQIPGLSIDNDGVITGSITQPGTYVTDIVVRDGDGDVSSQDAVQWIIVPEPVGASSPLVLNEYNAVADDREFLGSGVIGNGGDWFEFVVVEDNLDLRGYSIELWDLKGVDDQLRFASTVRFGNDARLARAPAGTIVTVSQDNPTDLNFDGQSDWHINFQIQQDATGEYLTGGGPQSNFNSTRRGQVVLIKDAAGRVVTPLSGETEAWDNAAGGVSGGEVMNLCADLAPGFVVDPLAHYQDNGAVSTFGEPNQCPDPLNPGPTVTLQDLSALRSSATFGADTGDTDCNLSLDLGDALAAAQYWAGSRTDSGPCFFDLGGANYDMNGAAADIDSDGVVTIGDALIIAQCSVGIQLPECSP